MHYALDESSIAFGTAVRPTFSTCCLHIYIYTCWYLQVHYALDESLISFGTAVDDVDYERAVDILETLGAASSETPAMWARLVRVLYMIVP